MTEALGVILVCMSALAEHCNIVTSPHVFSTVEECEEDVISEARKIKAKYSQAIIKPNCAELKYNQKSAYLADKVKW